MKVDWPELKKAIEKTNAALQIFEQRLNKLNENEKLGIDKIGKLLILGNSNYE